MTSPALFVISTTLVFSIFGIVLESTADYETNKMTLTLKSNIRNWVHKYQHYQTNHTNLNNPKPKHGIHNENNINKEKNTKEEYKNSEIDAINDEIDYDLDYLQNRNLELHRMKLKQDRLMEENNVHTRTVSQYRNSKKDNILHKNIDVEENISDKFRHFNDKNEVKTRYRRDIIDSRCEGFEHDPLDKTITHPHARNGPNTNYYNNTNCVTKINASSDQVIELTFVDIFHIEHHPECAYDYLEIRDGYYGYADLLGKFCGEAFPRTLITKGPHAWLKFHSDDTIEYEGFKILVEFKPGGGSTYVIPDKCYIKVEGKAGEIKINDTEECMPDKTKPLDVLWTIETAEDTKIYLNFTTYKLTSPNECSENKIQIFETAQQELDTELDEYCGSIANSITSNKNVVYIRLFASKTARGGINFAVTFNQFRTVDGSKGEKCDDTTEFDCEDSTCIDKSLYCDKTAHCRLKADEENCDIKTVSTLSETHILVILVIFSLILSGMSFVFLYKCIRKLYQDHKLIKEHIRQSCEDRDILGSRLTLDPKELQRDCDPRASLERENVTNEIVKNQRSYSKQKQSSLDSSDYIQETALDLQEEDWRRDANNIPISAQDIRIERNGRSRRSDFSKKEESIRSKTKESESQKREIRDVSVGAPDTKESGCQTRESLFQAEPPASSDGKSKKIELEKVEDRVLLLQLSESRTSNFGPKRATRGSGSNGRGFSTFGYSGATIARRSPPTNTCEVTIELLKQIPPKETKPIKKLPDRRPSSTETTRSAPDVIIVSKPIR